MSDYVQKTTHKISFITNQCLPKFVYKLRIWFARQKSEECRRIIQFPIHKRPRLHLSMELAKFGIWQPWSLNGSLQQRGMLHAKTQKLPHSFLASGDFCLLLMDDFCKQNGPRSGPTERWSWSGSKPFDPLTGFLKEFCEKVNFEKYQQTTTKARKFTWHIKS